MTFEDYVRQLPKDDKLLNEAFELRDIYTKLLDVYVSKNHDYGNSVEDTYNKYGFVSFLVRLEDKMNRLRSLYKNKEQFVNDEKIEDTLLDMANYAAIAAMMIKRNG